MNNIRECIRIGLLMIGLALMFILISPIIILILLSSSFKSQVADTEYYNFLKEMEGTKFFCYNNRRKGIDFIETLILPRLGGDVKIVFINYKDIQSEYHSYYISKLLWGINNKAGFPYLLRIENGRVNEYSINNELYNTIVQNKDVGLLIAKINTFFN